MFCWGEKIPVETSGQARLQTYIIAQFGWGLSLPSLSLITELHLWSKWLYLVDDHNNLQKISSLI